MVSVSNISHLCRVGFDVSVKQLKKIVIWWWNEMN